MTTDKKPDQPLMEDTHAFLEHTLIEAYLKGKGHTLDDLKKLPEAEAKQLMLEASTYASGKLAEIEVRAHLVEEIHDAFKRE